MIKYSTHSYTSFLGYAAWLLFSRFCTSYRYPLLHSGKYCAMAALSYSQEKLRSQPIERFLWNRIFPKRSNYDPYYGYRHGSQSRVDRPMAYPLSRRNLPGRNFFLLMIVFTLLFSGGIIPTYLVVKSLGLLDSIWAMILPNAIWSFNVLIMKSFFEGLPEELFESARMDGAKEFRILLQIVTPLSIPVLLTVGLFYLVGHWNEFFQAIFYVTDRTLYPLQVVVREILMQSQQPLENAENMMPTQTMQMAAVMIASLPVIIIYPFLQKHFTKGMLLGSIKG